jgi:hypothetical protein
MTLKNENAMGNTMIKMVLSRIKNNRMSCCRMTFNTLTLSRMTLKNENAMGSTMIKVALSTIKTAECHAAE